MFDKGGFVKEYSFLSLTRKKKENIVFIKKAGIFNTFRMALLGADSITVVYV